MSISDIYSAFGTKLATQSGVIVYENTAAATMPDAQTPYLRENMLNTDGSSPTLDGGGYEMMDGIYQVSVCAVKGTGKWDGLDQAQAIKDLYPRNAMLIKNDTRVNIRRVVINGAGYDDGTWWVVPVSVYWSVVD